MSEVPSNSKIAEAVRKILEDADWNNLTAKGVRSQLEKEFGTSLASKKSFINEQIRVAVARKEESASSEESEDEDEDSEDEEEDYEEEEEEEQEEEEKPRKKQRTSKTTAKKAGTSKAAAKKKSPGKNTTKKKTPTKKKTVKKTKKPKKTPTKRASGGLTAKQPITEELSEFMGGQTEAARSEVVKSLWEYIRSKDLQNPENRREILCDDNLKKLLGEDVVTIFSMNKLINVHFKRPPGWKPKVREPSSGGARGLQAPIPVSAELSTFLGGMKECSRSQVVKKLWEHIKAHDLQNPSDRREIFCDDTLKNLLGEDKVTMFTINKLISPHFRQNGSGAE